MKYNRVRMTRSKFDELTQDEQCLFVLSCHLHHRSQILSRAIAATRNRTDNGDEQSAVACQASLILKIHCGFLFEGWHALKKLYFHTPLETKWSPRLPPEGRDAAESLKKYFGKHSSVGEIRNRHGFHTDIPTLKRGIDLFSKTEDFDILVPTEAGPVLCPVAEHMTNASLIQHLEVERQQEFGTWVHDELANRVTGSMDDFCHMMAATIAKYSGATLAEADVEIPFTNKSELNLSYFVDLGRMAR